MFDVRNRPAILRYVEGERNGCPGCGRSQWMVGRTSAECAFCSTALPLADSSWRTTARVVGIGRGGGAVRRMMAGAVS